MVVLGLLLRVLAPKAMKVRKDIGAVARKVLHHADDKFVELLEKSGLAYKVQMEDLRIVYIPPLRVVWERAREKPCAFIIFKQAATRSAFKVLGWCSNLAADARVGIIRDIC